MKNRRPFSGPTGLVRSERGAVSVEFAFVLILMLLILSGIVEFGRAMWHANVLTKATRDGARLMAGWEPADMDTGVTQAVARVVNSANSSNIVPPLITTNVSVLCDYSAGSTPAFNFVSCLPSTAPVSVKVAITGYQFNLGEWVPFIGYGGVIDVGIFALTPHTVMPYLK